MQYFYQVRLSVAVRIMSAGKKRRRTARSSPVTKSYSLSGPDSQPQAQGMENKALDKVSQARLSQVRSKCNLGLVVSGPLQVRGSLKSPFKSGNTSSFTMVAVFSRNARYTRLNKFFVENKQINPEKKKRAAAEGYEDTATTLLFKQEKASEFIHILNNCHEIVVDQARIKKHKKTTTGERPSFVGVVVGIRCSCL